MLKPLAQPAMSSMLRARWLRRLGWSGYLGLGIISFFVIITLLGPMLAPHAPHTINPRERLAMPSARHPLGTDELGRDTLSRILYGSRLTLGTAFIGALSITVIGVSLGLISGYLGGWVDTVIMRVVDTLLAFPSLVVALAIIGLLGPGITQAMIGLVSVWWVSYARLVRSQVLSLKAQPHIESIRALGASHPRIILRHILPNVLPSIIVLQTLELGQLILALASLGFLGLGAQPPTPEWGAMINDGRRFLQSTPQLMLIPGLCIATTVLGFNLLGDSLRDITDAKTPDRT